MKFAVLGHPIKHSLSPKVFDELKKIFGFEFSYEILDIAPKNFFVSQEKLFTEFTGFNVTYPYKQKILEFLDHQSMEVAFLKATNVVHNVGQRFYAYNTDVFGFQETIKENNISPETKVLILGAGNAAKAATLALHQLGFSNVAIRARNPLAVEDIQKDFLQKFNQKFPENLDSSEKLKTFKAELVVQTTPIGMGDNFQENDAKFFELPWIPQLAYDLIYSPRETIFMKMARERGSSVFNGLDMLIYQAIRTFEIWFSEKLEGPLDYVELKNKILKKVE
jgi:shikimate dehydrogenase